jgi:hypothetical protein
MANNEISTIIMKVRLIIPPVSFAAIQSVSGTKAGINIE